MADLYEPDCGTAFYRSGDAIKNLRIKVKLERVTSTRFVPQAQLEQEAGSDVELQELSMHEKFGGKKDEEVYEFRWQEKVFSKKEVEFYSNEANCNTVLARKYHQDVVKLQCTCQPENRLSSYVDHDGYTTDDQDIKSMTTCVKEKPTLLAEKMTGLRQRNASTVRHRDADRVVGHGMSLVEYRPSDDVIRENHYMAHPTQTMYIMADLSAKNREATDYDMVVLCTIKMNTNGVLSIRPDFSKTNKPYKVEAHGIGRDMFEFTLEHASAQLSRVEQDREQKMFKELYSRHTEFRSACVGHEFELPPLDMLRLLVFGEIDSASNFEYSDLYVHYFVDINDGWVPNGPQQLSGVTQTCSATVVGRDEVAQFCFPFQFELLHKPRIVDEKGKESPPKWPVIYFEVLSLDSWQRYRTEGYGFLHVPPSPGRYKETVHCWRPAGTSASSELRRFFIGGSPELEDLTYSAKPSTFEGKHLSKFGFCTKSTGTLTIKLNVMQQSQAFMESNSSKKKIGSLIDRIGQSQAQVNMLNIIEAFQRAKRKMIAARENLRKDLVENIQAFGTDEADDADA